jgi:hypothetical protein
VDKFDLSHVSYELVYVEIVCNYIKSPSVSSFFSNTAWQHSVEHYDHLFSSIQTPSSLIKYPSSLTSLNKIVTFLRKDVGFDGRDLNSIHTVNKLDDMTHGSSLKSYNLFLNNRPFHDEAIVDNVRSWKILKSAYPQVKNAEYFDGDYQTSKFVLVHNLSNAPSSFNDYIQSGVQTSAYNNNMYVKLDFDNDDIQFDGVKTLVADSYLISDAIVYISPEGTLRIKN